MQQFFIHFHSVWRWAVLGLAIWAIVNAIQGVSKKSPFTTSHGKTARLYVMSLHIQFLLGIVLYFGFSPYFDMLKSDPSTVMKTSVYRFFAIEHITVMIIAVVLATIGNAKVKKAADDAAKHKKALIFFSISLILILSSIPWPFMEKFAGRGWF